MEEKNRLEKQLKSIIQWENPDINTLFYKWPGSGNEIKSASKIIISPGQGCIFVYEGKIKAHLGQDGLYDLKTDNIPFITTIQKVMYNFESEHKVGLFFYRKTDFLNVKWGTKAVIKYEDPKYRFPVGLRAFGNFSFKLLDPEKFFTNIISVINEYRLKNIQDIIVSRLNQPFINYLSTSEFSYTEVDSNLEVINTNLKPKISTIFSELGLKMTDFRIEGTNFDEATTKHIDKISEVSADVYAAQAAGVDYTKMQQLEALKNASKNEGGAAGAGVGLGAGMAMAQQMMNNNSNIDDKDKPEQELSLEQKLESLKKMLDKGLISEDDYKKKKEHILAKI